MELEIPRDALLPSGDFPEHICPPLRAEQDFLLSRPVMNTTPFNVSSISHPRPLDRWGPGTSTSLSLRDPSDSFGKRAHWLLTQISENGLKFAGLLLVLSKSFHIYSLALRPWAIPFRWLSPSLFICKMRTLNLIVPNAQSSSSILSQIFLHLFNVYLLASPMCQALQAPEMLQ